MLNPFPNTPFWELLKFREAADDNWNVAAKRFSSTDYTENVVAKSEIAHFEQFQLFPQCFPKAFSLNVLKWVYMEKRVNAGKTMNAVAINIGCSTHAVWHLRQRFQATGHMENRPRSGRPHVRMLGKDCYIWNTHMRNGFQTARATTANTHGTHNNLISAQTVCNCLHQGGLSAHCLYVGCVLA